MEAQNLQSVTDAVRLALVDPVGSTGLLVRLSHEHAADLAGAAASLVELDEDASLARIHRSVTAMAAELGMDELTGSPAQEAAVAALCRRHLAGEVDAREVTYWVWRVIGLRGTERTRPFMALEDEYTRYAAYDCSAIDADVTETARTFLEPPEQKRRGLFRRR